jgi:hypothetical protein
MRTTRKVRSTSINCSKAGMCGSLGAAHASTSIVNDAELTEAFAKTRTYLDVELPRKRQVEKYEVLQAGKDILSAADEHLRAKHCLRELRSARAQLQPEIERLDDEIRELQKRQRPERELLDRQLGALDAEENRLMTSVKLAIGPAGGIDGVASWESVPDSRRRFDKESLSPELFEACRTAFDTPRFRQEQPRVHESYMRVTTHCEFLWVDDDSPTSDTDAPGAPSGGWRRVVTHTTRVHTRLRNGNGSSPALISPRARPMDGA